MAGAIAPGPIARRLVPRTDAVLADPRLAAAARPARPRPGQGRRARRAGAGPARRHRPDDVADAGRGRPARRGAGTLRPVLNATGVVLHTNLGRAPLSAAALEALSRPRPARRRRVRPRHRPTRAPRAPRTLAALLAAVPEAGAVLVVNNGAAALVLATTALAAGREVVVSRGETGRDRRRLPAARPASQSTGARLREVGTTNRTTLADYAAAVGPDTGCVLKVHPSNFASTGFTCARRRSPTSPASAPPVVADIGSGLLAPAPAAARRARRRDRRCATAPPSSPRSGDKLLGGPQAGLRARPTRTSSSGCAATRWPARCGSTRLTLAALEATLRGPATPTWLALHADPAALAAPAARRAARPRRYDRRCVGGARAVAPGRVGAGRRRRRRARACACRAGRWRCPRRSPRASAPADDPSVVCRVEHGRLPARPALRRRRRPTTTVAGRPRSGRRRRRGRSADVHVVATAGHVDHGKSHAGPGAHRHGARPVGRGAPPRA